jgi:hypothetical protein
MHQSRGTSFDYPELVRIRKDQGSSRATSRCSGHTGNGRSARTATGVLEEDTYIWVFAGGRTQSHSQPTSESQACKGCSVVFLVGMKQ